MKINGPLWLNSIQSFLRKKKSLRSSEKNSSKRRLKKNLTSSWKKKKEKKNHKNKKKNNIINYKLSKLKLMISVNEKKRNSIKEKFNLKNK